MTTSDTAQIRKTLNIAFDDSALSAFCLDYYPELYDIFSQGMRKDDKITYLVDYCRRQATGFETLSKNVRKESRMSNFQSEQLKPLIDVLEVYIELSPPIASTAKETKPLPPAFTAPKPPKQFVQRLDEFEALIEPLLASHSQRRVAITTALQGGGGFGKTTLAQAICHNERVKQAFPDGILWVTIGQTPSLVELLSVQIKLFAPTETYADINAAANRLRALLSGKRVLVVLDDVWQEFHARPFVQDSGTCAHLITTRQQGIARWLQAQAVTVNEMQTSQAVNLLIKWLAGTEALQGLATDEALRKQLYQLAQYLGEWPLLLELAGAELRELVLVEYLPLDEAIRELQEALQEEGFTAFDRKDEGERNRAISISLSISLKRLGKWRERFMELAIFPEDSDIPYATIFKLWSQTAQMGHYRAKKALRAMRNLSLFTLYDAEKQTVRLHDVIRAYLAQQQAECLPDLHRQFLSAYDLTNWADLPADEPYLWHHLAYHLHEAKGHSKLRSLLLDFKWMTVKLNTTDINALLADYDKLFDDNVAQKMQRVLSQASHVLAQDKKQLASQLWGRLPEDERVLLTSLPRAGARLSHAEATWLRPLYPSLLSDPALVRTLKGHTDGVNGVTVTADGRWVLSTSDDGTVKMWDLASGQERLSLVGHTSKVTGVTVTADGRWALSASWDKTVKVWNLATGQERLSLYGHTDCVNAVTVTADGRWALSASSDKTVKVWDLASGQERFSLYGHTSSVTGVAVTVDGRWALSGSSDKTVKIWNLAKGTERFSLYGHTSSVTGVAVTTDGRWALSASDDRTVKVWDLASGQERFSLYGHTSEVTGVAVTTDGRWALSASYREVKVWDLASSQERFSLYGHADWVTGVVVYGCKVLTVSWDNTIKIWDLVSFKAPFSLVGHTQRVNGVAIYGCWALSASEDETVKVWDLASGQERFSFAGHTNTVTGLAVYGRWAFSASYREVKVWDLVTGQEHLSLAGHTREVTGVAVYGRWVLTTSFDKTVKVWDLITGQERFSLAGHTSSVTGVAVYGRWALSASWDKTVKVWDLVTGQERLSFAGHTKEVTGVAVYGCWGLSASYREVKVWNLVTGQERLCLAGHTDWVNGVAVTADGRRAVSASEDHTLKVWSLTDGHVLTTFDAGEPLLCCAMTPDGMTIVAAGVSGRVHFLRLEGLSADFGNGLNG